MVSKCDILNAKILIIDDKKANILLLERMLQGAGYLSITSTMDPKEVCALHSKNHYDLILLDLEMPCMDGFEVMEGLKEIETNGYLPVLVITAQPERKLLALKAGAKDFVSKPFDLAEVLARVHNMLEVRLLKSMAVQTALALENARLTAVIASEVAHRERLDGEVEIAREVQERLFPQTLPPIAGIEYSGTCRPALAVGGDYYDFLALPDGHLGIAIGDVSGKGIAAALMMASLQASLRGEAARAPENLTVLVGNINRLLYEASSDNRYATFFYAQYAPKSRRLTYVNAGHNPPMLFHRDGDQWQISRLDVGGSVVGIHESYPYEQSTVTISPDDVFIAFTDGISEAMNAADEEWGEAQLIETVKQFGGLAPSEIITGVMQSADRFVTGAKQHDDMTLVVLRMNPHLANRSAA